nr:MAG TPA: hypothetical protein [Caudoviricetes sp.]
MAVTGAGDTQTLFPESMFKLIKTSRAIGLTRTEIEVPSNCKMGLYLKADLPDGIEVWQTITRIELVSGVPTIFKKWTAIWKL